ncbi:Alpha/Beta hydrolase protein [Mycena leptocephala]|nr:Alpha/Beta hydrolase protein [Mycena leptocephala]
MHAFSLTSLFLALSVSTVVVASPVSLASQTPISLDLLDSSSPLGSPISTLAVSKSLYDEFVRYTKYASAAYRKECPFPLGNTLVRAVRFFLPLDDRRGFLARDNTRKEIVVSFPATNHLADVMTDMKFRRVLFISPGIPLDMADRLSVHRGFLAVYNVVAQTVLDGVKAEFAEHPAYTIVVTGHSLGGAIASLAAPALKSELPIAAIKLFTFGQPRVGNRKFAAFVEKKLGVENIFRNGVPTMVPRILGYRHFATEYWQYMNPILSSLAHHTVRKCDHMNGEDITCSMILRASLFLSLLMPILLSTRSTRPALLLTFILFIYSALQRPLASTSGTLITSATVRVPSLRRTCGIRVPF